MKITEVRLKPVDEDTRSNERLVAFVSVTFDDCFVVRDIKLIRSAEGLFVAMPSRKLTDRCPNCGGKNALEARFCNRCGCRLDPDRAFRDSDGGKVKLHADIAHPVTSECRALVQRAVVAEWERVMREGEGEAA